MSIPLVLLSWILGGVLALVASVLEDKKSDNQKWLFFGGLFCVGYGLYAAVFDPLTIWYSPYVMMLIVAAPIYLGYKSLRKRVEAKGQALTWETGLATLGKALDAVARKR